MAYRKIYIGKFTYKEEDGDLLIDMTGFYTNQELKKNGLRIDWRKEMYSSNQIKLFANIKFDGRKPYDWPALDKYILILFGEKLNLLIKQFD